ncbi:NAD(P)-binding protein [Sporosarcina sp. FSL K6-1522]|uniref:NAD(P)-binding protein n=1 Tax=Sporosarcina sp. FSL K6-1522 TaxID=2921554 RepID=UPI00315A6CEE
MAFYPVMCNVENTVAIVVGGGRIAYRKIVGLLQAGACVTVISPEIHVEIEKLLEEKQIIWRKKVFEARDLEFAWIVIAATNHQEVNEQVALATSPHQLVNVVDNPEISNFHVPAKLTRGDLIISVATGGASPTLAKVIRDELAVVFDDSYEGYLEFLTLSREKIKYTFLDWKTKRQLLKDITEKSYRQSIEKQQAFLELMDAFIIKSE